MTRPATQACVRGSAGYARAGLLAVGIVLFALLVTGGADRARAAAFQVSPTRFEFSLDKRFTNFFTVTNNGEQPVRVRVYPAFVSGNGDQVQEVQHSPYDLSPWLVLNPRRLNLRPGQRQVVRFSVRPPEGLAEGEYHAVVFFEELPPPPDGEQQGRNAPDVSFQIRLLTRLGITIYGTVGNPQPAITARDAAVELGTERMQVKGRLRNSGNKHAQVEVTAVLESASGLEAQRESQRLVLQRDQERPFSIELERPVSGDYSVHLMATGEGGLLLMEETLPLQVP